VPGIDAGAIASRLDSPEVAEAYERDKAETRIKARVVEDLGKRYRLNHGGAMPYLTLRERLQAEGHKFRSDTDTEVLALTSVLDDGSVANLTILWRVLDAWDHPENYARAVRSGENLTYHTSRAAASQLVGFLEHRLAQENEDLVVDGSYTGPVLLRHRDPDHDAVFRLSWA